MPRPTIIDRKATRDEVAGQGEALRRLAAGLGLSDPRLRHDGTVVVHVAEPGYRTVTRLSALASELVGTYVHVISDDVPGAADAQEF